jgi:hypothetical protein
MDFLVCYRPVFDAMRDDQEFDLVEPNIAVTKLHSEPAFHDQEQFVLGIVVMPHKRSTELNEFHLLPIQLPGHLRVPVVGEQC